MDTEHTAAADQPVGVADDSTDAAGSRADTTAASPAPSTEALTRLEAELAELEAELAELEATDGSEA